MPRLARRLFVPLMGALALMTAAGMLLGCRTSLPACNAGCQENGKRMSETAPARPRPIMIAVRSFRGSMETNIYAAQALLYANPRLGKSASEDAIRMLKATSCEPAHVIGSVTLVDSPSSVAEILNVMRAVTERFTPFPDPDPAHPVLKLELWWVAGMHGKVGEIELPDSRILGERWANQFFALSASDTSVNAAEQGLEERRWVGRVARMWDSGRKGWDGRSNDAFEPRKRAVVDKNNGVVTFMSEGADEADLLAQAAESSFEADIFHQRYRSDATFREDLEPGETVSWIMARRALTWFEPIAVALPDGLSTAERCRGWVRAVRQKALEAGLEVANVVIFDVTATHLRGMLIGERVTAEKRTPQLELDVPLILEHIQGNGWAGSKGISAALRIPLPAVQPETQAAGAGAAPP